MSKKIILIGAGILATGAAVTTGVVLGVRSYNSNRQPTNNPMLNEEAKKVIADYDNKSETEARNVDTARIRFSGVDMQRFQIRVKAVVVSTVDVTTLEVVFGLLEQSSFTISDDTKLEIKGFKKPATSITKEELDREIDKITSATYTDPVANIFAADAVREKITFNNLTAQFEALIKALNVSISEQTTLIVTFTLRARGGMIESKSNIIEIKGFRAPTTPLVPKTREQLNEILRMITVADYSGNKTITPISDADQTQFTLNNLPNNVTFRVLSFVPKPQQNTTGILTFIIMDHGGNITSEPKSLEISGFRRPFLTLDQLNQSLMRVTLTYEEARKTTTEVRNIDRNLIMFMSLNQGLIGNILCINPKNNDSTIAVIEFNIREMDGKINSATKSVEISGFRRAQDSPTPPQPPVTPPTPPVDPMPPVTPPQPPITPMPPVTPPTPPVDPMPPVTPPTPPTTPKTKAELNAEIAKITTLSYNGDKSQIEVAKIEKNRILFPMLSNNFEVIFIEITPKTLDPSVALITFVIRERGGIIHSDAKSLELSGFRHAVFTKEQLDKILAQITSVSYTGDKSSTKISEIDIKKLVFENLPADIELSSVQIKPKDNDVTTALITISIHHISSPAIVSSKKTFELDGFSHGSRTKAELDRLIQTINVKFDGDPSQVTLEDLSKINLLFENLPQDIEIVGIQKSTQTFDPSVLVVSFRIREKNRAIVSDARAVKISGFKVGSRTKADLDRLIQTINVKFDGNPADFSLDDLSKINLIFENKPQDIEIVSLQKSAQTFDPSTLVVSFRIREKNRAIVSDARFVEISGFRVGSGSKTKEQLDKLIQTINVRFDGNPADFTLDDLSKINLIFENKPQDIEIVSLLKTAETFDPSVLVVSFRIREKNRAIISDARAIRISGFRVGSGTRSKTELDRLIHTIDVKYDGDPSQVTLEDLSKINLVFDNKPQNIEIVSLQKTVQTFDPSTLVTSFRIREKNRTIISDARAVKIGGFKVAGRTKAELDQIISSINVKFDGDPAQVTLEDLSKINLIFENKPQDIEIVGLQKSVKTADPSTLIVSFRIREKNRTIISDSRSVEISGFKIPTKTKSELDRLIQTINVKFDGNPADFTLEDLSKINLIFENLPKDIEIVALLKTVQTFDPTTLVVSFRIREKNRAIVSDARAVKISGFKLPSKSKAELDRLIQTINVKFDGDPSQVTLEDLSKINLIFENLPKDIEIVSLQKSVQTFDPTTLVVSFRIREKNRAIVSDARAVKISGFMMKTRSKVELDRLIQTINVKFDGNPADFTLEDLSKINLIFENKPEDIEIVSLQKTVATFDPTILVVSFRIREKNRAIVSDAKAIKISGFKLPSKTKSELDKLIQTINVKFDGDPAQVTLEDLSKINLIFENKPQDIEIVSLQKTVETFDPTTLVVSFRIREKNRAVVSDARVVRISGFKMTGKSKAELDMLIKTINVKFDGNPAHVKLEDLSKIHLIFENLGHDIDIVDLRKSVLTFDLSTLTVSFRIREKNRTIVSDSRTVEISGFKTKSKSRNEVANDLDNINKVFYKEDLSKIELHQIQKDLIGVAPLDPIYNLIVTNIKQSKNRRWIAYVSFRIQEKGEAFISNEKILELTGFKIPPYSKRELDNIAQNLEIDYKNKHLVCLRDMHDATHLKNNHFTFSDVDVNNIIVEITNLTVPQKGVLCVKFRLIDKQTGEKSSEQLFKISGFSHYSSN